MNELYHHGILGQKWGVRRYQNQDGTLTEKGKKRFKKVSESKKEQKMMTKKYRSELHKESKKYSKRNKEQTENPFEKKIKELDSGTIQAGKDFIYVTKSAKILYVGVSLTGPKIKVAKIGKDYLITKKKEGDTNG